ncbi:MAG: type I 3-dehydroquinate dehydratase [Verrucomicrobia bacterium]|nr:type I 3-dehydroquinate dehydratase [Verrucomicrobiota bacterium]
MTTRRTVKGSRCKLVAVIASWADFQSAMRMKQPPDLFELRLDCLCAVLDQIERKLPILRAPKIITARDPREGGIGNLSLAKRRELLSRFLPHAKYLDVELRSTRVFEPLLEEARTRNVRVIFSYHDFRSTPSSRSLYAKARTAKKYGADIFKVATRTDKPSELARLVDLITHTDLPVPVSAMGIGKLGALSRLLLARCGSVLNYASFGRPAVEGQLPIELLRSALLC